MHPSTPSTAHVNARISPTSRWCDHGPFLYSRVSHIKTAWGHHPASQSNPGDLASYAFTYPLKHMLPRWQYNLNLKPWFRVSYQPFLHESHCPCNICWKEGFGFFPSPLLKWKQLKKVDWVSRSPELGVRCCLKGSRCLSIRSQVVRCLAQLLVQHVGTDRSVSVLALSVWTSSHLGGAFCKLSFLVFFNRSCALDSNMNVEIRAKSFFCIFLEGIKGFLA